MLRHVIWSVRRVVLQHRLLQPIPNRFFTAENKDDNKEEINKVLINKIKQLVESHDIVLFMKGTAQEPLCGFSQYVSNLIAFYKIKKFNTVDVTVNPLLKEALKSYSGWPTIPQLFVKGRLIGGYDIVKDMHTKGTFESLLKREGLLVPESPE
eukprot:TRINITY_DN4252_c0_g1_i9.p1 TRINITY_DN4252_c0_g1~~TRINITY_DN4252_c0_g1_i9.p1  ORF type:complete len:153 (+),score=43.49 TRINITY_DN4252_c0_g1_i9:86-544(+)